MAAAQPGWYADPVDAGRVRWWDGRGWTIRVSRGGIQWDEPLPAPVMDAGRARLVPSARATADPGPSAHADVRRGRVPVWLWIVIALVGIALLFALAPLVAVGAAAVLVTAIVGAASGTRTWLRFRSRGAAIRVAGAAAVVLLASGSMSAVHRAPTDSEAGSGDVRALVATQSAASPSASAAPERTSTPVTIVREETVTEPVAFAETTVEDASVARGESWVSVAGVAGERTLTYRVTTVDGVETARELVSDVVTVQPVAQQTTVGTYEEVAAAPVPLVSNCDSNYADACVPIASDVDCAGGNGNGPAYFDGVARVVGEDIYGLDRDGDGYACN
ncbi:G5 domain-containing protein [Microbacterium gorillae]|uniref:G5 domain-containing protein n=1 Tax=Microbacterium gorillae TaxID=1231063 RepID=UPI00227EF126|nr:G5 domain-containing protein [Microbacterium gorillae]